MCIRDSTYGMELMLALFNIVQGTIGTLMTAAGFTSAQQTTLPQEMIDTIESCGCLLYTSRCV